jgi:hypothetical protein
MGSSLTWVAVCGLTQPECLARLRLVATDEVDDFTGTELAGTPFGDWYLMVAKGCEHPIADAALLARLSQQCELLACVLEEHVMYSAVQSWRDGERLWQVEYEAGRHVGRLKTEGRLPAEFASIAARHVTGPVPLDDKNADTGFEIPLELARHVVGFRHDRGEGRRLRLRRLLTRRRSEAVQGPPIVPTARRPAWWQFWK